MNSTVYYLIIERYSMKTLHWYFPWATALHLYNMTGRGEKLQQLHCYHPFSDSLDIYLTKNHYENYSPKMVPIAKIWGSGSWTICRSFVFSCLSHWPWQLVRCTECGAIRHLCLSASISRNLVGNRIKVWYDITYPFSNRNVATVKVWEWISNFIPYLIMNAITYPCWDYS